MNTYEHYIHKSKYARYLPDKKRRETWKETVTRYGDFWEVHSKIPHSKMGEIKRAIINLDVMPSMRCLMTAGPALERDHVAGYNCAYIPIDDRRAFDEIMYILMCGTGVGFSVEQRNIEQLPTIAEEFYDDGTTTLHIADSRIGWATAFRKLINLLYDGHVPTIDYSHIRRSGARLATFGGRASGSVPLMALCKYTINQFKNAKGRKLNELEVHDLVCKIAETIVAGGVRRSALISLSDLTSDALRGAKHGAWSVSTPQRALSNNSACYREVPDIGLFLREWSSLIESRSGERGIFSRLACEDGLPERRESGYEWGCNPCSEIILRPRQFCNLTEVVCRPGDTDEDLERKVEYATILGTLQSTLTDFRYLGKKWQSNCEDERLLGVSLTGIMDCELLNKPSHDLVRRLQRLRKHAIHTNIKWAKKLGVNPSTAITCVKPSGTVSQLVNSSSGIHPRYSKYYIRRVRNSINDPLSQVLIDAGVQYEIDNVNPRDYVFSFYVESPKASITVADVSAIAQLELWKTYDTHWCEHKPSVSIYVTDNEWLKVGAWVYDNFENISGISFFPSEDHVYEQPPYESISKEEYKRAMETLPRDINFEFEEHEDMTTASQELACQGGQCEL